MIDIGSLFALGIRVGDQLVARGETIAVAESSAGGLISAALLARPGASAYYFGGAVLYTRRSRRLLTTLTSDDTKGLRSSSPPFARCWPATSASASVPAGAWRRRARQGRRATPMATRPATPAWPSMARCCASACCAPARMIVSST